MSEPMDTIKQFNEAMAKIPLKDSSVFPPWRKPEERPEVDEDLLLCINWKRCMGYYSGLGTWRVFGGGYFEDDKIQGWCYADELPLPDWVQK